jgi:flavin-dependent dehydrogenase
LKTVVVVGGGLGGLISAYSLARKNVPVTLIEKKKYPFHRVCGEYISNETIPFLKSLDLFPTDFQPPHIDQLQLTSVSGREAIIPLDLGGFGISRYAFDHFLYERCVQAGVRCYVNTEVESIHFQNDQFEVKTKQETHVADVVIGSFGKRSKLDVQLQRGFLKKRSPYVGVKYHIRTQHPANRIALHNFKDGYCGISNVEDGKSTLCYLTHRDNVKRFGNLPEMERQVLFRNPFLKKLFTESAFLWERPEVINEISFATKSPIENHVLMCGDAAGMITPLCGNGMAIAIHASKILVESVEDYCNDRISRKEMEDTYQRQWNDRFASRLWVGRQIQQLFGSEWTSNIAVDIARYVKPVANFLVKSTHGQPF